MKKITLTFADGAVTITTEGFRGAECLAATAALERDLGETTGDRKTGEFCALPTPRVQQ